MRLASLFALVATLAACQAAPQAVRSRTVAAETPRPPATGPTPTPPPTPRATEAVAKRLQRAPGDVQVLKGTVMADVHYMHEVLGLGTLLDGGLLIGNNGGSVIGNNGGNVIANNGGNVIANNGGNFNLLALAAGTVQTVGGMELRVIDLVSNQPLSLGVDDQGQPVTSILTDARGAFEVYLPRRPDNQPNVRVVATVPGRDEEALAYDSLGPAAATKLDVDEDTVRVTLCLREWLASRIDVIWAERKGPPPETPAEMVALMKLVEAQVAEAAAEGHVDMLTPKERHAVALAASDAVLAYVSLAEVKTPAGKLIMEELRTLMHDFREQVATKFYADPAFYKQAEYYKEALRRDPAAADVPILRPVDVIDFMLERFVLTGEVYNFAPVENAFETWGVPVQDSMSRIQAASQGLTSAFTSALVVNPDASRDMLAAIRRGKPAIR